MMMDDQVETTKIAVFRGKQIRKTIHGNEWWFSIIDVIEALTGNERPRKYWNDLKKKLTKEGYSEVSEKIGQLKLEAADGKNYLTDCANTETVFRIIQTIPSPKAEPLKRWLAKVGYERVQEIEDPELATKRTRAIYKAKAIPTTGSKNACAALPSARSLRMNGRNAA
jgi:DNA-damage-inducible protein D